VDPQILSSSVERMVRVERKAVIANGQAVAALVDGPDALVAIPAQRAQRPETELVVIAAMPWVMVGDRGRRDAALLVAQSAERGSRKLMLGPPPPGLQRVPCTPMERLRGCEVTNVHRVRD
jgi:hypothetical protein